MRERKVLRGERKRGGKREERENRKEKWSHGLTNYRKGDYRWQDDSQRVCYSLSLSDFVEHLEVTLLLDAVCQNWKFIIEGVSA